MLVRRTLLLVTLLSVSMLAACAEVSDGPAAASPAGTPATVGSVSMEANDGLADGGGETPAEVGDTVVDVGIAGLSTKTTRGHVWAEPSVDADLVAIPLPVATLGDHVHFEVDPGGGAIGFVGYFTEGAFFVRANVCPGCGEQRIEWGGSLVACRACGATFDAVTGEADGEGRGYPAGTLPCAVTGDAVTMSLVDLVTAHARTVAAEATLFELPEVIEDEDRGDTSWPRCCGV